MQADKAKRKVGADAAGIPVRRAAAVRGRVGLRHHGRRARRTVGHV